jgi:hypothetical protein
MGRWPIGIWTIQKAADRLGVTRTHLSLVIHGHREGRSLKQRYRALVKTSPN